jgi:pimeloyl-ACP methyl ester carboxylesterase
MPPFRSQLTARTADGVRLAIKRFAPRTLPSRGAVVLQHGLGSNGLAFTLPGVSLAEHLSELGFDCFVPELRGAGASERPRASYGLDEYLEQDIPAILDTVLEASGHAHAHWIGHSMGGILMWMYGSERPDARIARLITVGSAMDYRPGRSVYRSLKEFLPLIGFMNALPFQLIARAAGSIAGSGPIFLPESMNFFRSNVDREVCRQLMTRGFSPIPVSLFDSLATTFSETGFTRAGGAIAYLPKLAGFRIPTLVLGGTRDVQCPPEAVTETFERLTGCADKRLLMFGKAHGHEDDYGHFDLLVGKRAAREVWPHVTEFLGVEAHDTANDSRARPEEAKIAL